MLTNRWKVHIKKLDELAVNAEPTACGPRKLADTPFPVTALASFPGSGNTWARHLIEHMSGNYNQVYI